MSIDPLKRFLDQLPSPERWLSDNRLRGYLLLLLLAGLVFQLLYPVVLYDSDMWYHLDGGRYFWTQGEIPNHAFFSFITPERTFTNYYWGFQALIYKVYEWGDYQGLLILRSLLVALTVYLVYRFLLLQHRDGTPMLPLVLLFILYFTLIEGRLPNLRPHLFSQLFMISYLLILEKRRAYSPLLPLLTVFWANLHGIEYPVPVLIGGAYFIEICWNGYRNGTIEREDKICLASLLSCIPALLATPHGIDLLATPFTVAEHVNRYIGEMRPLDLRLLYSFSISGNNLSVESVFSLAFFLSLLALARVLLGHKLRLSHIILAIGAFFLLAKGTRFVWEWAFLMLPLLGASITHVKTDRTLLNTPVRLLIFTAILLLPVSTLFARYPKTLTYPLSIESLPLGTLKLIKDKGLPGKVFSPPTYSGFIHWKLGNKFKVLADLQMSLFDDMDIFHTYSFYRSERGLKNGLATFAPDFILVDSDNAAFSSRIASNGNYSPVMFDDKFVLFASKELQPNIVDQYRLETVNPFLLETKKDNAKTDRMVTELQRVLKIYPTGNRALHALTRVLFNADRLDQALPLAQKYALLFPGDPNSEFLVGNILENSNRCKDAIPHFKNALRVADNEFKKVLHSHIGSCYYVIQNFDAAYVHLWKGINPFSGTESDEDLYQLAFSSFVIGKVDESALLLRILLESIPKDKVKLKKDAQALLDKTMDINHQLPGFFRWLYKTIIGS